MPKKIIILTTGQPSTNPRMVKEYSTLKSAGFQVKVYYSYWQGWATHADSILFENGELDINDFTLVGGSPTKHKWLYHATRIYQKINKAIYKKTGLKAIDSFTRTTPMLVNAAKNEQADLYIAHNAGALPAAVAGASEYHSKAGFDAEDYHRGEYKDQHSDACKLLLKIENKYLPHCDYITTASPLISEAYHKLFPQLKFTTINNVFSKLFLQPYRESVKDVITLFWFSQTIGPDRGLETVVKALNSIQRSCKAELYLMGNVAQNYVHELEHLANDFKIQFLPPEIPDKIFEIASRYDIGLSIEVPDFINRDLCLTNKIFTYLLAGNCIIFSNTKAQVDFCKTYHDAGFLFDSGNDVQLANIIRELFINREKLELAKRRSLQLATDILNWENEQATFLKIVNQVINN